MYEHATAILLVLGYCALSALVGFGMGRFIRAGRGDDLDGDEA